MPRTTASQTLASAIVQLASPVVPRAQRDDWRAEWTAELDVATAQGRSGVSLVRAAVGAPIDACWLRQRQLLDSRTFDDARHGWRQLHQHAGFTTTAVGILGLGMAASIVAFAVVSQILLRPLPYPAAERIVTLWERPAGASGRGDVSPGNFIDLRDRVTSIRPMAAAEPYSYDYSDSEHPEVWHAANVTEGFFDIFGVAPILGRTFRADDHQPGTRRLVMSERVWRSRFTADPALAGATILLDDQPYTVVGIVPASFEPNLVQDLPGQVGVWVAKAIEEFEPRIRASGYWHVVGRLANGRSESEARAEVDTVAGALEIEYPRTNTGLRVEVRSLREHLVGDAGPAVRLFSVAVLAVLIIACVNVTNLLLARGAARHHELAIRSALGASRRRLVAQLLVESLVLASLAGIAALALAWAAIRATAAFGPPQVLWIDTLQVDGGAAAFALLLAATVAVAAGLLPAWRQARGSMATGGNTRAMTGDPSQRRLRSLLVAGEVAMALVLVAGCALLLRSFINLLDVDTGFERRGVIALQMFAWDRNPTPAERRLFIERASTAVSAVPGVTAVGAVSAMPFIESNIDIRGTFRIAGQPDPAAGEEPRASFNVATPGYFDVLGIPLVRGRHLDARDSDRAPRVGVITDVLAARYFRTLDPIGSRITLRYSGQVMDLEIVGVIGATRHERLDDAPRLEIVMPHAQAPTGSMTLVARSTLEASTVIEPAKAAVWDVDPLQSFHRTATLDQLVDRTLATRRFALLILVGFAATALLLATAGLYGVLSAVVSQYRREIGVRLALGASWLDIVRLIVARGLAVAAAGVAAGLVGAIGTSRLLEAFLFSVAPTDPASIGGAAFLMLLVSAAACYLPARRAAMANPAEVLRAD